MSKKNKQAKNHRKNEITKGIFTVLEKEQDKSFDYKAIAAKIGVTDAHERNMLIQRLVQLKETKRITEESRGHYKAIASTKSYHTGTVDITGRGNAYIVIEGMDDDVFVPFNKLKISVGSGWFDLECIKNEMEFVQQRETTPVRLGVSASHIDKWLIINNE